MKDVPQAFLVSPIISIVLLAVWILWFTSVLYLYSVGTYTKNPFSQTPFGKVTWDKNTRYALGYFLFGGLWKNAFIQAVNQFVIASSVAIWYFSQGNSHKPVSFLE